MDALETLVRDALTSHAADAPGPDALTVPDAVPRRWPYAVLAAAAVLAVAVGVVATRGGGDHHPAATPPPTFAPVPQGMNEVSYHGITFDVPDNVPIGPGAICSQIGVHSYDPHAIIPNCPAREPSDGLIVWLTPYQNRSQELGNPLSRFAQGHRDLRTPGVSVDVEAPTKREVDAVLDSIRVTPLDRNGCAGVPAALHNASANEILPGKPIAVSECTYTTDMHGRPFLLYSVAEDSRADRIVAAIRGLSPGRGTGIDQPEFTRFVCRYADGSTRVIEQRGQGDATFSDGTHVVNGSIAYAFD